MDLKETCKILRKNAIKGLNISKSRHSIESENDTAIKKESKFEFVEEFPESAYDLLKKLLELDCDKRVNADVVLSHPFFTTEI